MVAQGHGKFGPIVVADPRESFRIKKKHIIVGDFNYNLIIPCVWGGDAVLEKMVNEGFCQSVTKPTRITGSTKTRIRTPHPKLT